MPSVQEELAELRRRSITSTYAANLKAAAGGLSTPEAEEHAIKTTSSKNRVANYKKDAVKTLNAGVKAVDQELDMRLQQMADKKEDQKKRRESTNINQAAKAPPLEDKAPEPPSPKVKASTASYTPALSTLPDKKETDEKKNEETPVAADVKATVFTAPESASILPADKPANDSSKEASPASTSPPDAKATVTEVPESKPAPTPTPAPSAPIPTETAKKAAPAEAATPVAPSSDVKATASDDQVPELEEIPDIANVETVSESVPEPVPQPVAPPARVQNRAEKKAIKMMQKLGMTSVKGISRVTIKLGGKQGYFTIFQPEVYEKSGSYIVFGEARQGSGFPQAQQQQAQAVQQLQTPVVEPAPAAPVEEEPESEAIDETGVEAKDVDLVISQAGCTRAKAVQALKDNDGDLVNAIMSLTT